MRFEDKVRSLNPPAPLLQATGFCFTLVKPLYWLPTRVGTRPTPTDIESVRFPNSTYPTGSTTLNSTAIIQIRKGLFPLGGSWQIFLPNP